MTLSDISTRITFLTGADTNNFTDANRLIAVNQAVDEIEALILRSQDGWEYDNSNQSADPILTANITANTQSYSLSAINSNLVQVKRVEICYNGTDWWKATKLDLPEYTNTLDSTTIGNEFPQSKPKYALIGGKIYLFPIPDTSVTAGLKVVIGRLQVPLTSSDWTTGTKTPGFDRNLHDAVAIKAAYDYCMVKSLNNTPSLEKMWLQKKAEITDWYSHKSKDKKYNLTPKQFSVK